MKIKKDENGRVLEIHMDFIDSLLNKLDETETSYVITSWTGAKRTYIKSQGIQIS